MKITVCDDSIKDLLQIDKLLAKYKTLFPDNDFDLEKFSDPSRLYQKITDGDLSEIYILDMLMPGRTGIDLGRQIRKSGCESAIIYITSSEDLALDAYGVHAVRYLLKPIDESSFFEALDYALSSTKTKTEPMYLIKAKEGLLQRPCSQITYIENVGRRLEVHMKNGETVRSLFIRKSFEEEIREVSEKKNFLQVHKSFLVNLDYVKQITSDSAVMESGIRIPVSKARSANVKRQYLMYISEKYR